jgi:hypothetical protein
MTMIHEKQRTTAKTSVGHPLEESNGAKKAMQHLDLAFNAGTESARNGGGESWRFLEIHMLAVNANAMEDGNMNLREAYPEGATKLL